MNGDITIFHQLKLSDFEKNLTYAQETYGKLRNCLEQHDIKNQNWRHFTPLNEIKLKFINNQTETTIILSQKISCFRAHVVIIAKAVLQVLNLRACVRAPIYHRSVYQRS